MSPRALHSLTCHPQTTVILLLVSLHRIIVILLLWREGVDVSELEEAQVLALAVCIILDALEASEQQSLAHHVEIGREGVHDVNQRILLVIVIRRLTQRVVQDLVEALTHQLLADKIGQLMLLVLLTLDNERALQLGGNLHIIISIDTQDILHHIARTLHIDAIGRDLEGQSLWRLVEHLHLQALADALDGLYGNLLADE